MSQSYTAIIVVHYGAVETTVRCLQSLAALAQNRLIIISNNGSEEDAGELQRYSQEVLKQECLLINEAQSREGYGIKDISEASIIIIQNNANKGFAAGCNAGIKIALEQKEIKYIWLLNNDTRPDPNALAALVEQSKSTPRTILGSTVLLVGQSILQLAGGVAYSPFTTCIVPAHAHASLEEVAVLPDPRLDYIYGASLFAPVSLFAEVGMLDDDFFLFYEELDICLRAKKKGYFLEWCRDSVVHHEVSAAIGKRDTASRIQKRVAAYHEARSTILFTYKHYPHLLPFALFARLCAKSLALAYHKELYLLPHAFRGILDGVRTSMKNELNCMRDN